MDRTIFILALSSLIVGCAGNKEANRVASIMANATSTYVQEVDNKIDLEREVYQDARGEFEEQLADEKAKRRALEKAGVPLLALLDVTEEIVRNPEMLGLPGDLLQVLEDYDREQTRIRLGIANSEAEFREAYDLNLVQLHYKRARLEELRKQFEGLAQGMSARDWFTFVVAYAQEVQSEMKSDESEAQELSKTESEPEEPDNAP